MASSFSIAAMCAFLAVALSLITANVSAFPSKDNGLTPLSKRFLFGNDTVTKACQAIKFTDKNSKIIFAPFAEAATRHYMSSSSQSPGCTVAPATLDDLSSVIKLIGDQRIEFAVQSGGHASNQGFSSTKGIHITMSGFKQVNYNADSSTVEIGTGNLWDDVYAALKDTGRQVVGGRVSGVGVGGFLFAGGGYSWLTNQYGLTADTLQSFNIVLPDGTIKQDVTSASDPDLFFALKGGGNQFGVVSTFTLKAFPQSKQVWGGIRTYAADQVPKVLDAISYFNDNNKDPKAQIIPTLDYAVAGAVEVFIVLAFYDGPKPPADIFAKFDDAKPFTDAWATKSFMDLVKGTPSEVASGHRGAFHSVQLTNFSRSILDLIASEAKFYGSQAFKNSGFIVSYDVEPFDRESYGSKATESAWPHKAAGLPLNLYFGWDNPADDSFWQRALLDTAGRIKAAAIAEGQKLDDQLLYPNYALASTPVEQMYGGNVARLRSIRQKVDPKNVMGLTTAFRF